MTATIRTTILGGEQFVSGVVGDASATYMNSTINVLGKLHGLDSQIESLVPIALTADTTTLDSDRINYFKSFSITGTAQISSDVGSSTKKPLVLVCFGDFTNTSSNGFVLSGEGLTGGTAGTLGAAGNDGNGSSITGYSSLVNDGGGGGGGAGGVGGTVTNYDDFDANDICDQDLINAFNLVVGAGGGGGGGQAGGGGGKGGDGGNSLIIIVFGDVNIDGGVFTLSGAAGANGNNGAGGGGGAGGNVLIAYTGSLTGTHTFTSTGGSGGTGAGAGGGAGASGTSSNGTAGESSAEGGDGGAGGDGSFYTLNFTT